MHDAAALAGHFVAPLGRRWLHVQAVTARAVELSAVLPDDERWELVSAAWLHDIGYSPQIGHTRFHPLDGARYLREQQWPERIVNLVAHHSGARFEAIERGLADDLAAFPFEECPAHDALATADLTTGPGGEPLTYDQRVTDILDRYPEHDAVHRAWVKAAPILRGAVQRTEALLVAKQRETDQA
jgi:hypothetical protein